MHANFARDESCRWCNPPQVCRECSPIGGAKHGACNGVALVDEGLEVLEVDCLCASGNHGSE
ncbi:hypothetical protein J2X03_003804 [Microbacterium trichothecenolyticum]|nr:hypothetical protein [Microbacterium trichothecenolyticum]